jgi:hypothetical protein
MQRCPNCGNDLAETSSAACPICGTVLGTTPGTMLGSKTAASPGAKLWIGALFQFAMATIFMVIFRFPKFMIVIFGVVIAVGTALSAWAKQRPLATPRASQQPVAHPTLLRVIGLGIALFSIAFLCFLLFGFVIFINNWNDWHRYQGQPYHVSTFQVTRTYFQRVGKGGIDAYASGMVDGNKEWMGLRPYLPTVPRSQEELDARVPAGTSIPIYLFPQMKGRSRVRMYDNTPTAEGYRRAAMNAVNYGLGGVALCATVIFLLTRLRRICFAATDSSIQQLAAFQGR